jgi:predicted small secreted protein
LVAAACLLVASCETIKGVGRDIENAGEAIDDAVDD